VIKREGKNRKKEKGKKKIPKAAIRRLYQQGRHAKE